jgi:hypothetical protein
MALCLTLTAGTCFKKCGHYLNQTNDFQDATKFGTGSWKAGVSFQEYVTCSNDVALYKVQTLKQMLDSNRYALYTC